MLACFGIERHLYQFINWKENWLRERKVVIKMSASCTLLQGSIQVLMLYLSFPVGKSHSRVSLIRYPA